MANNQLVFFLIGLLVGILLIFPRPQLTPEQKKKREQRKVFYIIAIGLMVITVAVVVYLVMRKKTNKKKLRWYHPVFCSCGTDWFIIWQKRPFSIGGQEYKIALQKYYTGRKEIIALANSRKPDTQRILEILDGQ